LGVELMIYRHLCSFICSAILGYCASSASAAILYSDDFNSNTSANYNTYVTAGSTGPSGDATFTYNYGDVPANGGLSIPVAPHTSDGSTTGLRLRTDNLQASVGTVVGATSVVTKNLSLPSSYRVQVDVWDNYIGGTNISASGSNGTTAAGVGIGTAGTSLQYIAGNDGLFVEAFGDNGGGANQAYRVYTNNTHPNPTTKPYWAAGTSSTSASFSDPYYTSAFPSVSAPAGQSTFAPGTQGGSTAAGTLGFAWHTWTITNDSLNVTWAIDGKTIATIPTADYTSAGSQISLNNDDTGLTGNSAANNQLLNAHIFDNLVVSDFPAVPEPASCTLIAVGMVALGLAPRRRGA
jgi:hypothetical protein